jgi:tRNA(Arg) A34 adenosine deaminase TadA
MCTSAAIWAKVEAIVYGATMEDMAEYCRSNGNNAWSWRTIDIKARDITEKGTPRVEIVEGIMRKECKKLFHKN